MFSAIEKYSMLCLIIFSFSIININGQANLSGKFDKYKKKLLGISVTIYEFSRKEEGKKRIKAKYFAHNANSRFNSWRDGKNVLLACSGAFSESWQIDSPPHGLCVDNGDVVNRNLVIGKDEHGNSLDGLVIVFEGGKGAGGIVIKDIEHGVISTPARSYDIKDSNSDKVAFTAWAESNNATVFQLPLMYSKEYGKNYGELNHGSKKERRYLAICEGNDGIIYHLIIDVAKSVYMNEFAKKIKEFLSKEFSEVYGLLVLDTGGKNILYEYFNGYGARIANTEISEATNLLVYYYE